MQEERKASDQNVVRLLSVLYDDQKEKAGKKKRQILIYGQRWILSLP